MKLLNPTKGNSINKRACLQSTISVRGGNHDYSPQAPPPTKTPFRHRGAVPEAGTQMVCFVFRTTTHTKLPQTGHSQDQVFITVTT